jgi:hypothetical protein
MKRPSFQFYPADWLRDTALRTCSVAARGLWMDMLCFMHEGNPYGYLKVRDKVILPANLASMTGLTMEDCGRLLGELKESGVYEVDDGTGAIFSRRMVRDEYLRTVRAEGGKLGGNPKLTGGKVNLPGNLPGNLPDGNKDKQKQTPSSSSSSSSSSLDKENELELTGESPPIDHFQDFWKRYPRKESKADALKAWNQINGNQNATEILSGLSKFQFSEEQQFRPLPATWLRKRRWEDEPLAAPPTEQWQPAAPKDSQALPEPQGDWRTVHVEEWGTCSHAAEQWPWERLPVAVQRSILQSIAEREGYTAA